MGNCLIVRRGNSGGICYRYLLATIDKQEVIPNAPKIEKITASGFYNGNLSKVVKGFGVEWGKNNTITIQFEKPINAIGITSQAWNSAYDRWTKFIELLYSDDGINYTSIGVKAFNSADYNTIYSIFESKGSHKYWKMYLESYNSNWQGYVFDLIVKL